MNLAGIHAAMRGAADLLALPLRRERFAGTAGALAGRGSGSSLEFQDHRRYVPGDDPRHINWSATARTGEYVLKQWREEVSPSVELLLDHSPSMFLGEEKGRRTWELAYFCIEAARRSGARLRVVRLGRGRLAPPEEIPLERALAHDWPALPAAPLQPAALAAELARAETRPGAIRVLVSDLLDPSAPGDAAAALAATGGRALVLAPSAAAERDPDWSGNVEWEDCESGARRLSCVDDALLARYRAAWRRHVAAWREASVRRGIGMALVAAEGPFLDALRAEAVPAGIVEPC